MQILWTLYRAFFMIGALTFGGGYAMLPMLEREIVAKHKWATQEEILDYFAMASRITTFSFPLGGMPCSQAFS